MKSGLVTYEFLVCDAPGAMRRMAFRSKRGERRETLLRRYIALNAMDWTHIGAIGYISGETPYTMMSEATARVLLRALGIADGVEVNTQQSSLTALACLICRLPMDRRALLYYDCCACLGYDPAELPVG